MDFLSLAFSIIIPSLTVIKLKNGHKASNYAACDHFFLCNDMY